VVAFSEARVTLSSLLGRLTIVGLPHDGSLAAVGFVHTLTPRWRCFARGFSHQTFAAGHHHVIPYSTKRSSPPSRHGGLWQCRGLCPSSRHGGLVANPLAIRLLRSASPYSDLCRCGRPVARSPRNRTPPFSRRQSMPSAITIRNPILPASSRPTIVRVALLLHRHLDLDGFRGHPPLAAPLQLSTLTPPLRRPTSSYARLVLIPVGIFATLPHSRRRELFLAGLHRCPNAYVPHHRRRNDRGLLARLPQYLGHQPPLAVELCPIRFLLTVAALIPPCYDRMARSTVDMLWDHRPLILASPAGPAGILRERELKPWGT